MKINKLHIGNFGKFKNYELELKDGFHIVYGNNEDGKSTLMAFIKIMFYKKLGSGNDINKNIRKKYQPWDGSRMNGAIEFEHDGVLYRLEKDIGITAGGDKVNLINMDTGKATLLGKDEDIGKRFFGIDLAGFERSVYISQIGSFSADGKSDEIAEKLSNLVSSGEENTSEKLIMKRINDALEDMISKSRKKGILIDAENELNTLLNERSEIQMLEIEQREKVKEYHSLEKKLKEQKDIQKLLKLNEDKIKFQILTDIIEKITQYTESEKRLEKENIPYEKLEEFLAECSSLMEESEKNKGSLEKFKGLTEGEEIEYKDKLTPISDEEHLYFKSLVQKEKVLKELLDRVDENFIPVLKSYIKEKCSFKNQEETLKENIKLKEQLKKFHEDYKNCEDDKNTKIKEKDEVSKNFENDKYKWNYDKQEREKQINSIIEKLSIKPQIKENEEPKREKNNQIPNIGIVIGIISIIIFFFYHLTIIAVIIAIVISVFSVRSNKYSETSERYSNFNLIRKLEEELQDLKKEDKNKEELVQKKIKEYELKMGKIKKSIDEIEKKLEFLRGKSNEYIILVNNINELETRKYKAANFLDMTEKAYNQEKNKLIGKYLNDQIIDVDVKITALQSDELEETDVINYRNRIKVFYDTLISKIEEKLKEKSCTSEKEYESKFLDYASDLNNQKKIAEIEKEYAEKAKNFINKVNEYDVVESYEEAKALIKNLSEQISQLEKEKYQALNIAKGMGYSDPSIEYLKDEKNKFEASVKLLEEMGRPDYSEEELIQKEIAIADKNIEERLFELQKQVKTPDKNFSQIQNEINEKEVEVNEKREYFNSLKIVSEVMQESSDEIRKSFGPELNLKTAEIFKKLTNEKYGNLMVTKDYDISIQSGINYRQWKYLSNGTIDQAYLSLRLAITELISDKNILLPLFLDDVLIQYDDERMDAALQFISYYANQKGNEFQLILFTCHRHIIEKAKFYTNSIVEI